MNWVVGVGRASGSGSGGESENLNWDISKGDCFICIVFFFSLFVYLFRKFSMNEPYERMNE